MPMPRPGENETQREFISRCMGDDTMNSDYPERDQRAAVCFTQWRKDKGKSDSPGVLHFKASPEPQMKTERDENADAGWLEGYASVFDVVDLQGDRVIKGAFKKTIGEMVKSGKVHLMSRHLMMGGDTAEVVGIVTEAEEDAKGLKIHAEFSHAQSAQDVRVKVQEGLVNALSIGYRPIKWEYIVEKQDGDEEKYFEVRVLKELALHEVTLTTRPACEPAQVTGVKYDESSTSGQTDRADEKAAGDGGGAAPQASEGTAKRAFSKWDVELMRMRTEVEQAKLSAKAFSHNNRVDENEPKWGSVVKTKLPRRAFADMGEADRVSSWRYPHHWVRNGGNPDDDGRYTTGTMLLHRGGLGAAWAAAHGARAGTRAPQPVLSHLDAHRRAIGMGED